LNFYYNSRAAKVSVLTVFRLSRRPSDGIKLRERSRLNFDFGRLAKISLSKEQDKVCAGGATSNFNRATSSTFWPHFDKAFLISKDESEIRELSSSHSAAAYRERERERGAK
jgi:hypothetical protein